MSLKIHFTISLIIGLFFGLVFQSCLIGILSWLIGWLIDCDHLLDYFLYFLKSKKKPSLKDFFSGNFFEKSGKIYVLAHGWEYLILFIIFGSIILSWQLVTAVSFAYFLHLVLDQYVNKTNPFIYFLFYRIKVGFAVHKLCLEAK